MAQSVAPDARIVHVDNDPIALVHAQTPLNSSAEGAPPTSGRIPMNPTPYSGPPRCSELA
ncbi:SAM-dependent methyltransferase [Streptomyces malaysiensis]|uniref:SAM-dependent methyltransferase n=1 Tax=Streptomyces malaysiensis TaxID=92644 RepID=UPI003720EA99